MSAAPALPRTGFKFTVSIRTGPDAGAMYQLLPPRVTIGRDPQCNIPLRDPKVSRQAALIEFTPERITVQDISNRGTLFVNNQNVVSQSIKGGDVIRVGDSEFAFVVEAIQLPPVPSHVPAISQNPGLSHSPSFDQMPAIVDPAATRSQLPMQSNPSAPPSLAQPSSSAAKGRPQFQYGGAAATQKKSNRPLLYGGLGLVVLVAILAMSEDPAKKDPDKGLKPVSEIEKEIADTEKLIGEFKAKKTFKNDEERTRYEEAQRHYLEGFRDYQKGNYPRAISSLGTALAIDSSHQLARRYKSLAEKRRDEHINSLLLEGRKYMDKAMFSRCVAAYDKALLLMPNRDDIRFKQADLNRRQCKVRLEDRF